MRTRSLALMSLVSTFALATASGCVIKSETSPQGEPAPNLNGIPADPGGQAPQPKLNNLKPAARFSRADASSSVVRINLLGLIDPKTQAPIAFKANETIFITEDGVLKGIRVAQSDEKNQLPIDIVFVVDNSGSMGEEADGVADKISSFATLLAKSGLDVRFGAVGYDGGVTGAIDLGSATELEAYLNREGKSGTSRTHDFAGTAKDTLEKDAIALSAPAGENGIVGIVFAEKEFGWRENSQRIFVNFTDEPTQPSQEVPWTTKTFCARWTPQSGTVHTVWSGSRKLAEETWTEGEEENPEELSKCTPGAVVREIKDDASDLDLTTLPLTQALRNSALVEFNSKNVNVPHNVVVTVKNGETADGKTELNAVIY